MPQYLEAGADIVETNSFNANAHLAGRLWFGRVWFMNSMSLRAQVARRAAIKAEAKDGKPRFVAGAMGPTTKSLSIPLDVNNPAFARN